MPNTDLDSDDHLMFETHPTCVLPILLSMEWNSMRVSDSEHQKVSKTIRTTVLRGGGGVVHQHLSKLGHNLS